MGDGQATLSMGMGGAAEEFAAAKTSVWWDIENCQVPRGCDPLAIAKNISSALLKMNYCGPITISAYGDTTRIPTSAQHALSSTGIALNHVPAGVKDASDKKILVNMLFWAVDNPAPANYLLISGDRDFSNALHQLRLRRYNILVAHPAKKSAALVAAAKCVWNWTSLVYGGLPVQSSVDDKIPSNQTAYTLGFQVPSAPQSPKKESLRINLEGNKEKEFTDQPESCESKPAKKIMKAPHEFFSAAVPLTSSSSNLLPGNNDTSSSSSNYIAHTLQYELTPYVPDTSFSVNNLQSFPLGSDGPRFREDNDTGGNKPMSWLIFSDNVSGKYSLSSTSAVPPNNVPGNDVHGSQEFHPPPNYVQGLVGVILIALNTLKVENIIPTETNITDCIRYGDPKYRKIDVRKALACACDQKMIVKKHVGMMELYVGRTERLWPCENPVGGNAGQYQSGTWAAIQDFITSSAGSRALKASECRYDAALILKNSCLRTFSLGEVIRILNLIITTKQWIKPAVLGWQPVSITLLDAQHCDDTGNGI